LISIAIPDSGVVPHRICPTMAPRALDGEAVPTARVVAVALLAGGGVAEDALGIEAVGASVRPEDAATSAGGDAGAPHAARAKTAAPQMRVILTLPR
jgi:hypothetical protein